MLSRYTPLTSGSEKEKRMPSYQFDNTYGVATVIGRSNFLIEA